MKFALFLAISAVGVFQGCASGRTEYERVGRNGGYSESQLSDGLLVARFQGNSKTTTNEAAMFSQLRAIELCQRSGKRLAIVYDVADLTKSKNVEQQSATRSANPVYIDQVQSGNSAATVVSGGGQSEISSKWTDTFEFPAFDTYFGCTDHALSAGVQIRPVPASQLQSFYKDMMGAVQITSIGKTSPNRNRLYVGDIITKVGNSRIETPVQWSMELEASIKDSETTAQIIRDGKIQRALIRLSDVTDLEAIDQSHIISSACRFKDVRNRPVCAETLANRKIGAY